jgi:hypothetical protein
VISNNIPSPYTEYAPSEYYSSLFLYYLQYRNNLLSEYFYNNGCFSLVITNNNPSPYTGYDPLEHYYSMFRLSTISRVITAPYTRKASKIISYPSTLAQWLLFISDNKYYPKSLQGLCSVRVLFLNVPSEYYSSSTYSTAYT